MKWTRSCLPELIRASPMTRKNRTIRQRAARNSYSRATRPMPPQRSRDVAKVSSSVPESLPAAISCSTGRNSSSRWKAIPSETHTNVAPMRLTRSGEAANLFAGFVDFGEEGKDLVRPQPCFLLGRLGRGLCGRLAREFVGDSLDQDLEVRQLPPHHPESGGLDLSRRLRVVPEISEGAGV